MKIFFENLNEKIIAIKWITVAIIAARMISVKMYQDMKKADNDGIVIKIAIIVPFTKISLDPFFLSSN